MRILLALCAMTAVASASPAWPFDDLLGRAETVFVGDLTANASGSIELKVTRTIRGKPATPARFDFDAKRAGDLPKDIVRYVVISQGDDHFGKPTAQASLRQDIKGQAGYRGWIVFPVLANGDVDGAFLFTKDKLVTVKLDQVAAIVARSPYKPKR